MIKLKRESKWADRLRAYKVVLDGNVIGYIKNGEEKDFDVPDGSHKLSLKIDWCRSNSIKFDVPGNSISFECGSSLRGWKLILAIIYISLLSSKYIWLKRKS